MDHFSDATVIERMEGEGSPVILRIRPDRGPLRFEAGQHLCLSFDGVSAYYSICSSPDEPGYMEICIGQAIDPVGARFRALEPGDVVGIVGAPSGSLTLARTRPGAPVLMIASGTGASPFVSMLRTASCRAGRDMTLIHGARSTADLVFRNELDRIGAAEPRARYVPILSRPDPGWSGDIGRARDIAEREISRLGIDRLEIFLCGKQAMVGEMSRYLGGLGLDGRVYAEAY